TLRSEGIETFTPEEQEKVFRALVGMEGGTAAEGYGTCGACLSPCFIISYFTGVGPKDLMENRGNAAKACINAKKFVTNNFLKEYGSICCREIRYSRTGIIYNITKPDGVRRMLEFEKNYPEICGFCTTNHPISKGAAWAVEGICDMKGIK
nr:C_GCAxxG_C_C family protein [Deltaproteobacteria bacterium]